MRLHFLVIAALCGTWLGCGTTKWSDTARTATEQLLISDSMDRAVSDIDFRTLAGKKVFVDDTPVKTMTDSAYLVSTVRQHVMASGGILKETKELADYVVEVRAGAIGTDHHDVMLGVPAVTIPTVPLVTSVPSSIPEIPFVKKTDQRAVSKIAVFVYNRQTGRIVWQSGLVPEESRAKAVWVFGAGPFQRGAIYNGTSFAGSKLDIPLIHLDKDQGEGNPISVADQAFFVEPKEPPPSVSTAAAPTPGTAAPTTAAAPSSASTPASTSATPPTAATPPAAAGQPTAAAPTPANAPSSASTQAPTAAKSPVSAAQPNATTSPATVATAPSSGGAPASASQNVNIPTWIPLGPGVVQAGLTAPRERSPSPPLFTPLISPDDREPIPTSESLGPPFDGAAARGLRLPQAFPNDQREAIWGVDPMPNYRR